MPDNPPQRAETLNHESRSCSHVVNGLPIVLRPLRTDDVVHIFAPVERGLAAEWLARQERGELYVAVAELDGKPIGRICLDLVVEAAEGAAYCFAAGVKPEWRSRGIGSQIDHHLEMVARRKGFQALTCSVAKTNLRSRAFFERLGYRCIGEGPVSWVEGDGRQVTVDCWKLTRSLSLFSRWMRIIRRTLKKDHRTGA